MAKPSVNPKIFAGQDIKTLKHDEYLLLVSKNSPALTKAINDDLIKKFKAEYEHLGIREKFITYKDEQGEEKLVDYPQDYFEAYKIRSANPTTYKEIEIKSIPYLCSDTAFVEIYDWEPEKPIIGKNGYYIGSVDLYVTAAYPLLHRFQIKEGLSRDSQSYFRKEFIFEFKPEIKSFSEVIRQIKVYQSYFPKAIPICLTESDISSFKDIFENQGITIINIKESQLLSKNLKLY